MLLSAVPAKLVSFLLLSTSAVLATPLPEGSSNLAERADGAAAVLVLTGAPELLDGPAKRFALAEAEADDAGELAARQISLPPTKDHVEGLRLHNAARLRKGLLPLVWDKKLETDAKAYARIIAAKDKMEHSSNESRPGQGENLAFTWSSAPILNAVTRASNGWLAEEKFYTGQKIPEGDFASYGHWTQCTWRTTTKVGIATASNGKGAYYIVARYSPPGNYIGQKPY